MQKQENETRQRKIKDHQQTQTADVPSVHEKQIRFENRPKKPKALWIDIDQTLLDFDLCAQISLEQTFDAMGLEWKASYYPRFSKINDKLWDLIEQGRLDYETLKKIRFSLVLADLRLDADPDEMERIFHDCLHDSDIPVDGALPAIQALAEKYPLFIATNGPCSRQSGRVAKAGLLDYFIDVFASDQMGAEKPDPQFFIHALERCQKDLADPDLTWDEMLLIGDSVRNDMSGAMKMGMQTIWFCKGGRPAPAAVMDRLPDRICTDWQQAVSYLLDDESKFQ